jgi:hypothetical protein
MNSAVTQLALQVELMFYELGDLDISKISYDRRAKEEEEEEKRI